MSKIRRKRGRPRNDGKDSITGSKTIRMRDRVEFAIDFWAGWTGTTDTSFMLSACEFYADELSKKHKVPWRSLFHPHPERAGIWQPLAIGLLGGIAGLRRGEMLALEQKIIDYAGRRLPVVASSYKGESVPTKGKRFRVVGMNDELAAVLKRNRHLRGPLVFYTAKGKPGTYKALYRWFDMACAKAKLTPSGKLHVLRHTFGSLAASAGVDLHRIQSSLGHSDQRTTEIYARMAAQAALEVTGKIDKYLRSAKAKAHK